jgi:hypothetical protein
MTTLVEEATYPDTQLLDEHGPYFAPSSFDVVVVEDEPTTGVTRATVGGHGVFDWSLVRRWPRRVEPTSRVVMLVRPTEFIEIGVPEEKGLTLSFSAPALQTRRGTGYIFEDIRRCMDAVRRHLVVVSPTETLAVAPPVVLDVPEALQEARMRAGLPVQDLAAMFGIKRRQFYNLISGEDAPDPTRERRIARVTEAIRQVSELLGANSRKTRAFLLARLDGDSLYEAAVAGDEGRISQALERALIASGETVARPRLAPSRRATPEEAAAVRDFIRATRDQMGDSDSDSA